MLLRFFINSQCSGGEVWSPKVLWSNLEQEYAHLRVVPGAISLVEKKKLGIKQTSQRQQLEGSHKPHHELHIYIERETYNKLLQSKWIQEGLEVYVTNKNDQTD